MGMKEEGIGTVAAVIIVLAAALVFMAIAMLLTGNAGNMLNWLFSLFRAGARF